LFDDHSRLRKGEEKEKRKKRERERGQASMEATKVELSKRKGREMIFKRGNGFQCHKKEQDIQSKVHAQDRRPSLVTYINTFIKLDKLPLGIHLSLQRAHFFHDDM